MNKFKGYLQARRDLQLLPNSKCTMLFITVIAIAGIIGAIKGNTQTGIYAISVLIFICIFVQYEWLVYNYKLVMTDYREYIDQLQDQNTHFRRRYHELLNASHEYLKPINQEKEES